MAEKSDFDFLVDMAIPSARGKRPKELGLKYVRNLGEGDLDMLQNPPPKGSELKPLAKIKHSHHALARLLAQGVPHVEASKITGYSPSWISNVSKDPAFKELLAVYKSEVQEIFLNVHERLGVLTMDVVEEIQHRLMEAPETFSHKELRELLETVGDRSIAPSKVAGKGQASNQPPVVLNIKFAEQPGTAVGSGGLVIDGKVVEV